MYTTCTWNCSKTILVGNLITEELIFAKKQVFTPRLVFLPEANTFLQTPASITRELQVMGRTTAFGYSSITFKSDIGEHLVWRRADQRGCPWLLNQQVMPERNAVGTFKSTLTVIEQSPDPGTRQHQWLRCCCRPSTCSNRPNARTERR